MGFSMMLLVPVCAALVIGACFAIGKLFAGREPRNDE